MKNLIEKIPYDFRKYKITKIESGASKRSFYRLINNNHSVICIDSGKEKENYLKYLNIYSILSKINISIPKIYNVEEEHQIIIVEDFGNMRFDRIISDYSLKELLLRAVDTLLVINRDIKKESISKLQKYNFNIFKSEISEIIDYYYPYVFKKNIDINLKQDFYYLWENIYNSMEFDFSNFVHKDFNINNLIFLPNRKNYLQCGIIDYQDAFLGECSWDLFSLLEDSRIFFDNQYNDYFLEYFFKKSQQNISISEFKLRYNILNCSRQTRLLGRWVKLNSDLNQNSYLNFIPTTKKRLLESLKKLKNEKLTSIYSKIVS